MSRIINILSLSRTERAEKPRTVQDNLEYYKGRIYKHEGLRPDIIVLPEHCPGIGVPKDSDGYVQEPDGPAVKFFAAIARDLKAHIILPMFLADHAHPGNRFNSALVLDSAGKVIGRYDKIYPTQGEYTGGVTPGALDQNVIQTCFGPIGLAICFDSNFPALWQRYGEQGAKMVFWPSAWNGGRKLNAYAALYYYHVISSTYSPTMRHIDPLGFEPAAVKGAYSEMETRIDLDEVFTSTDYVNLKVNDIRKKYGGRIQIEEYMHSDAFRFVNIDPALSVAAVLKEFGLVDYRTYLSRAQADADTERRQPGTAPRYTERCW